MVNYREDLERAQLESRRSHEAGWTGLPDKLEAFLAEPPA